MLLLLLLLLLPNMVPQVHTVVCSRNNPVDITHEWYEEGDLVIGGIVSFIRYLFPKLSFKKHPSQVFIDIPVVITKFYQHILALVFAVDEINENPKILPNVTLGFHIYDSYFDSRTTYRNTLDLLFKSHHFVPNYICGIQKKVVGVIGGLSSDTSSSMADVLGLYKIPQVGIHKIDILCQNSLFSPSTRNLLMHKFEVVKLKRVMERGNVGSKRMEQLSLGDLAQRPP
ncbi:vomeronasal type-2 receptor 26-like [Podarcis muralis]